VTSVSRHIQRQVTASAQTAYALRVLRSSCLCDTALQHVYRATVIAQLKYAASAWRGLASTSDRQRIDSMIDRARRPTFQLLKYYVTTPTTSSSARLFACRYTPASAAIYCITELQSAKTHAFIAIP